MLEAEKAKESRRRKFQRCVCEVSKLSISIWTTAGSPAKHIKQFFTIITQHSGKETCRSFSQLQPTTGSPAEDEAI